MKVTRNHGISEEEPQTEKEPRAPHELESRLAPTDRNHRLFSAVEETGLRELIRAGHYTL